MRPAATATFSAWKCAAHMSGRLFLCNVTELCGLADNNDSTRCVIH
jgi:hypothetical protein